MYKKLIYCFSVFSMLYLAGNVANAIPFYQDDISDGLLTMEAENYDVVIPQGDHTWELVTDPVGFSGTGAMRALPDTGDLIINEPGDYLTQSPRLDYEVNFVKSGTHYVWIRCYIISDQTNSCHVGINGNHTPTADRAGNLQTFNQWLWAGISVPDQNERLTIDIPSPGVYTINVWMREDGFWFDKIVFTTNPDYTPTDLGPEENPRGPRTKSFNPVPKKGEILTLQNTSTRVSLSWLPGVFAVNHNIYFGTDVNDVDQANLADLRDVLLSQNHEGLSFEPPVDLEFDQTYYWRVDDVNDVEVDSPWKGDLWSFTTANYIVLEDFEDYNDIEPDTIYYTWIDGFGDPANGSIAGYPNPDFVVGEHYVETTTIHSGSQSMPVFYDNSAGLSEVTKTLDSIRDWTIADVMTLTLFYYGDASNDPEQMYVAINGNALIVNDDPRAALDNEWNQWDILLQDFADQGVNLANVNSISLGFGDKTNPAPGGKGLVFFDDIRLYRSPPIVIEPEPESVDPGTNNLVAYYAFENNAQDGSGNGQNGTLSGNPEFISGPTDFGMALELDGTGDYVTLPIGSTIGTLSDCTITAWVNWSGDGGVWQRIFDFGTGDTVYMFLTCDAGGGSMRFALTTDGNLNEDQTTSLDVYPTGWHHVAVTIDPSNTTHTLYLDGKITIQNTSAAHVPADLGVTNQNWLGRSQFPADPYFRGSLDEFRMYDRVLSRPEILYLAGR